MSSVDLSKLIAHKKFFVPEYPVSIHKEILKQLKRSEVEWKTDVKRSGSGTFRIDLKEMWVSYALLERGLPDNKKSARLLQEEYEERGSDQEKLNLDALKWRFENSPFEVHYVIRREEGDGCTCEATCIPTGYFRILRSGHIESDRGELVIQDARLRCEEFLVDVFVGGLGAREIVKEAIGSKWELLTNDVNCQLITERIYEMLDQATGEVLLTGWMGTLLIKKLKQLRGKGIEIRIITHAAREAKGQPWAQEIHRAYRELKKVLGDENIVTRPELHGRTVIVDNKAIIGSMDLNAYSLTGPHIEFAVYTEDVDTVRRMRSYFKKMFTPLE